MLATLTAKGKSLSSFLDFASSRGAEFSTSAGPRSNAAVPSKALFASSPIFLLRSLRNPRRLVVQRNSHGLTYLGHRSLGNLPCPCRTSFQNIPRQPRILLIFLAPLPHGIQDVN